MLLIQVSIRIRVRMHSLHDGANIAQFLLLVLKGTLESTSMHYITVNESFWLVDWSSRSP